MRSMRREPHVTTHNIYAEAVTVVDTDKGPCLLCWLEGDSPPPNDPQQLRVPPDQRVEPFPVPLREIFMEGEVRKPGDSGTMVVSLDWAEDVGLV